MIDAGLRDRHGRAVTLSDVGDDWHAVADVVPRDDQREFVFPMAARYLLLSLQESVWNSLAVRAAARGYAGCEVLAFSNAVLGRDDQVGCPVYSPIDAIEETRRRTLLG